MKKWNKKNGRSGNIFVAVGVSMMMALVVTGCGSGTEALEDNVVQDGTSESDRKEQVKDESDLTQAGTVETGGTGIGAMGPDGNNGTESDGNSAIADESAGDAQVDFAALKAENPEIFGWLYIPDTSVDAPILQSSESDDYYETHNAARENDTGGALYIEAANLASMCDFNTVIHGRTTKDGESGIFKDLYRFSDPDYFDSHEQMYLYLEDNVLTYEIFAAYERENTSLIRTYDFTYFSGCDRFLKDMYNTRSMNMMIRSGWEEVTPYHFLVTLTTVMGGDSDKQFVVLAALIEDPAGNIDRMVVE